jgi:hypothetical protein
MSKECKIHISKGSVLQTLPERFGDHSEKNSTSVTHPQPPYGARRHPHAGPGTYIPTLSSRPCCLGLHPIPRAVSKKIPLIKSPRSKLETIPNAKCRFISNCPLKTELIGPEVSVEALRELRVRVQIHSRNHPSLARRLDLFHAFFPFLKKILISFNKMFNVYLKSNGRCLRKKTTCLQ